MTVATSLLALVLSTATGWFAVARWLPASMLLRVCLAFGAGLFIHSCVHLAALAVQCRHTFAWWAVDYATLAFAWCVARRLERAGSSSTPVGLPERLAAVPARRICAVIAALATLWVTFFFIAMYHKSQSGVLDAWAIWNLKAACFFRGGEQWTNAFSHVIDWSHPDYPLLLSLNVARLWSLGGQESFAASGLLAICFSIATVGLLYALIERLAGCIPAAIAVLGMIAARAFLQQGASQLADVPVGFMLLVGLGCAMIGLREAGSERRWFCVAGLFAGAAAWTKNEGLLMMLAMFAVLFLLAGGKRRAMLVGYALGAAAPLTVVVIFKLFLAGPSDLLADASLARTWSMVTDWSRHAMIGHIVMLTVRHNIGDALLLSLLVAAVAMGVSRAGVRAAMFAAVTLMLIIAGYHFVYLTTPYDLIWHLTTSVDRLLMQLWPAALLALFSATRCTVFD